MRSFFGWLSSFRTSRSPRPPCQRWRCLSCWPPFPRVVMSGSFEHGAWCMWRISCTDGPCWLRIARWRLFSMSPWTSCSSPRTPSCRLLPLRKSQRRRWICRAHLCWLLRTLRAVPLLGAFPLRLCLVLSLLALRVRALLQERAQVLLGRAIFTRPLRVLRAAVALRVCLGGPAPPTLVGLARGRPETGVRPTGLRRDSTTVTAARGLVPLRLTGADAAGQRLAD